MNPRSRRIIKTPRPYLNPRCKCYYIKITGIDGKRKQVNLLTSDKKEARVRAKREVEILNAQLDGTLGKILSMKELVENYFKDKVNLASSTRRRSLNHINFFFQFMLPSYPQIRYFNQINSIHVANFQTHRKECKKQNGKSVSNKTVKESMYVISSIFEWALKKNYVRDNPVRKIDIIKSIRTNQHVFKDQEVIDILTYCKNSKKHEYLYAPFLVLATTGVRRGELSHLTWDDIDFTRRVIKIRTKILPSGKTWTAKTRENRELKMDNEVFDELFQLKIQSNKEWVFINTQGNRQTGSMLLENLNSRCKQLGIPKGQIHSFRRGFAQMMDKAVHDRVAIQQTLGHSTITMTDLYCGYRPKEYVDKAHLKTTSEFIRKMKEFDQLSK